VNKRELLREVYATYLLFWLIFSSRVPIGSNVFEEDWDLLVILDACRVDALREVQAEYDFLNDIDEMWSVGGTSKEWIEQTFRQKYSEEISNTAYVTGNPFSNTLLGKRKKLEYGVTAGTWVRSNDWTNLLIKDTTVDPEQIGHIEPLWGDTGVAFSDSQKPDAVMDYTIQAARTLDSDRLIAHFMQPHSPYFSTSRNYEDLEEYEQKPFEFLKKGEKEKVWGAYIDNLRYVLDYMEVLIENFDGSIVLTADHGELMGDHGMYYHMPGNPHPKLKKVPWVRIEGSDKYTYEPDVALKGRKNTQEVSDEQLEALGYI